MLVWAYRKGHEIITSLPLYEGPADVGGKASCGHPVSVFTNDGSGSILSGNEAIEEWVRKSVDSAYHSWYVSTFGMQRGWCYGSAVGCSCVDGLRCADMSIRPNNLASNTASVAMTVGEKAAALILEDLLC